MGVTGGGELAPLLPRVRAARHLLLLLDYDGTLVPHVDRPDLAVPDPDLLALLDRLARRDGTELHIVSGRAASRLQSWLGGIPLFLHAEHGALSKGPGEANWVLRDTPGTEWQDRVAPTLAEFAARAPGALVERKQTSLAWHWRSAEPEAGRRAAEALTARLREQLEGLAIELQQGDMVLELRPLGVHKGLISGPHAVEVPGRLVIAAGNDRTDEDLFDALADSAITVVVGDRPSGARYRVSDVWSLRRFLAEIAG